VESEEIWMDLHALHRHGWSISALARKFHLNRRTVTRQLEAAEPRRYPRRAPQHPLAPPSWPTSSAGWRSARASGPPTSTTS
jgi:transposase